MTKLTELKKTMLKNSEVKHFYDETADEFQLISAIIEARSRAGLTQEELALRMNTKQSLIARLESGSQNTTIKTLQRVAEATGTHLKISFDH